MSLLSFFTEKNPNRCPLTPKTNWEWFLHDFDLELKICLSGGLLLFLFILWLNSFSVTVAGCV